jgi:hypothetical protein
MRSLNGVFGVLLEFTVGENQKRSKIDVSSKLFDKKMKMWLLVFLVFNQKKAPVITLTPNSREA